MKNFKHYYTLWTEANIINLNKVPGWGKGVSDKLTKEQLEETAENFFAEFKTLKQNKSAFDAKLKKLASSTKTISKAKFQKLQSGYVEIIKALETIDENKFASLIEARSKLLKRIEEMDSVLKGAGLKVNFPATFTGIFTAEYFVPKSPQTPNLGQNKFTSVYWTIKKINKFTKAKTIPTVKELSIFEVERIKKSIKVFNGNMNKAFDHYERVNKKLDELKKV